MEKRKLKIPMKYLQSLNLFNRESFMAYIHGVDIIFQDKFFAVMHDTQNKTPLTHTHTYL